ncbi:MvdC/MvdD family ATP grasp protein [Algicola sagamiensis]|nr:hypothetical protein [Algicola sagamiensis]
MAANTVLIVTQSRDNECIDSVSDSIRELGGEVFRLNSDEYPTKIQLAGLHGQKFPHTHQLINEHGQTVNSEQIRSLWYRRFLPGGQLPKDMDLQYKRACMDESKRTLLGFMDSLDVFKMDDYWHVRRASNKELQLILARNAGLHVPDTLITNQPEAVKVFFQKHNGEVVTKMQAAFSVWRGSQEQVVFTSKLEASHLAELDGLALSPMIFQEKIDKELEMRVTIVGNKVFTAAIDPKIHDDMECDWRRQGLEMMDKWFIYDLPSQIAQQLLTLTRSLNLNYGAVDLILDKKGQYHFLEINPCGEFFWLDHFAGLDICQEIARLLYEGVA